MTIEIANRLIELRKSRGLSQEELAEKLGLSRQAVSKWERAESSPDIDNIMALSKLYGISVDELLCNENSAFMDASELALEKSPEPDDTPMGGADGVKNLEVTARANLELMGTDDAVSSVDVEGPEDERSKVRVFTEGPTLCIIMDEDEGFFDRVFSRHNNLNVTVRLPRRMDGIEVKLKGGNLKSTGVNAESMEVKLGGGRAAVEDCRVGKLELKTGGGSIILRKYKGSTAELLTGGGGIMAEGAELDDRLEAKTGGGSVVITASVPETEASSGGGDVRLRLANPETVEARTGGGAVSVELTGVVGYSANLVTGGGKARLLRNGETVASGRSISITEGDGRTRIGAKSGGGSVKVSIE